MTRCSSVFLLILNMKMADAILHCLNVNLSMHFRVRSRNPAIFNMKLYVTTVNNSFQSWPIFRHKELHLRCWKRLALNIVTWSTKILKGMTHTSTPWSSATLGKYEKHTLLDALKTHLEVFNIKFNFLHLISNGLDGVNNNSLK